MIPAAEHARRLRGVTARLAKAGAHALLITPGADLEYLIGYRATPLERLTCLVVTARGEATLIVPALEEAAATASPVNSLPVTVRPWAEGADPIHLVRLCLADLEPPARILVDDHMWASRILPLQARMPFADWRVVGEVLAYARMRKSDHEVRELRAAARAMDAALALVPGFLRAGVTEREVATSIGQAMLDMGHDSVDFVIVASGPNSASPHHEPGDRPIAAGDPIVVDAGGALPSGYRSDTTRTFFLGSPDDAFARDYAALQTAQADGITAARKGAACGDVDRACRQRLEEAGLAEFFVHRTGHGIGLETHEPPYIQQGDPTLLEPGFAFSVEPGFYRPGRYGARIEDIVVCTDGDPIVCNSRPRELCIVDP